MKCYRNLATIAFFVSACMMPFQSVNAQYEKQKEQTVNVNKPLSQFVNQQKVLFNFGWKFQLVNKENTNTDFSSSTLNDSGWRTLDLPHDFQFEQPWTKNAKGSRGFKPMCAGWYRKTFKADEAWKGMKVSLDFGGIIAIGDVYINGHKIASTEYGYVGLEADMSKYLNYGGDNVVAVYASTGPVKGSRWYTGGGIFRDVYLQVQNPTHIARHGIYVTTPNVRKDNATVQVQVEVDGWQGKKVSILTRIKDANGRLISTATADMPKYTKQQCTEVKIPTMDVISPNLWSTDNPYLYNAEALVYDGGVLVDSVSEQFGIRTLEFSPEYGFKLNGKKIFLQGVANHHDMGALGAAAFDKGIERMMLQLKAFGYNAIRCSHNPYSESFTKIADRVGMLIVDELIDKWSDNDYWAGRQPFTNIWYRLIPEWIKRDRNSPSVILWSLGNELQIRENWTGFAGMNDWGVTTYRIFDQLVKRFDSTRLTTVAMFPARWGALSKKDKGFKDHLVPPELSLATDVCALNYLSENYKDYVKNAPGINIFQSEAETSGKLSPYYNMDYNHSIGLAYWGAIEYWGESNGWPKKGWNYSFFNHTLRPYPQAYLIRSAFKADEPLVHIGVFDAKGGENEDWNDVKVGRSAILEHWNFEKNSKQKVVVFTNAYSVELFVNGKSQGIKINDDTIPENRNTIIWPTVDYGQGGNIIAIARDKTGKEVARHQLETAGKVARLVIEPETKQFHADGMDLLYLNVRAVDKKGRTVPDYQDALTVHVDGQASLYAIDNGDHYTNELFHDVNVKNMKDGYMQVILRASRKAGPVKLSVQTKDFKQIFKTITY